MANKELKFGSNLVIVEYAKKDRLGNQIDTTYVSDFTKTLSTGGSGVRPTKFISINYTGTDINNAVFITLSALSCHVNGSSYMFMEDITLGVGYSGNVRVENLQSLRTSCGTYDGVEHFYGDIFYTVDTTNKVVDFYILCGQYSTIKLTPYKRRNSATAGTITQYTGTATYYSTGTKTYGNNGLIAMTKDIPTVTANPSGTATTTLTKLQVGSTIYSVGGSAPSNMVTTDTTQTITGTKTLTNPLYLGGYSSGTSYNGELYLYFAQQLSNKKILYSDGHNINVETMFGAGTSYDPANPSDLKLRVEGKAYYVHSSSSTPTNNDEIATKGDLSSAIGTALTTSV